jgi:hypothetical protein
MMARSRSSFDLTSAIATATSLKNAEGGETRRYEGVPLVSFEPRMPGARPATPPPAPSRWPALEGPGAPRKTPAPRVGAPIGSPREGASTPMRPPSQHLDPQVRPAGETLSTALPFPFEDPTMPRTVPPPEPPASRSSHEDAPDAGIDHEEDEHPPGSSGHLGSRPPAPSGPPRLPDLSRVVSPIVRCERIVSWISEATGATEVFLADSAGLPMAGAIHDVEARLAGSGLVASSIASLVSSIPGSPSPIFEVHLGEGPFFQLIGFQVGAAGYIIGLIRARPLTPRQAQAIRVACRHALGATLGSGP